MKKTLAILFAALTLGACQTQKITPVKADPVDEALVVAANNVSSEMRRLVDINRGREDGEIMPLGSALKKNITIHYDGSVDGFISEMRRVRLLSIKEVGKKPQVEMLLSLHYDKTPMFKILEDVGAQMGTAGDIVVGSDGIMVRYNTSRIQIHGE